MVEPLDDVGERLNQVSRPQRAGQAPAVHGLSIAVDPVRPDQHGGPPFFGHGPVIFVPVVMLPAGRGEDSSAELP